MDRFSSETYAATPRHFRSEEDYYEFLANNQPEPEETEEVEIEEPEAVPAELLSACCAAEKRTHVLTDWGTCQETGYHDDNGPVDVCAACGGEFEPMLQPVFTARVAERKPVTRQQGELFEQGVA